MFSFNSHTKRSYFHLSESQRVLMTSPAFPFHTVSVGRVVTSQVETVQVGSVTVAVPPATFVMDS